MLETVLRAGTGGLMMWHGYYNQGKYDTDMVNGDWFGNRLAYYLFPMILTILVLFCVLMFCRYWVCSSEKGKRRTRQHKKGSRIT
eukprot:UN06050